MSNDVIRCHLFQPARASRARMQLATWLVALLFSGFVPGCVAPKRASFVVPRRCIKVDAQSFTRPCQQRADGKIVCDGVIVTADCIEAKQ